LHDQLRKRLRLGHVGGGLRQSAAGEVEPVIEHLNPALLLVFLRQFRFVPLLPLQDQQGRDQDGQKPAQKKHDAKANAHHGFLFRLFEESMLSFSIRRKTAVTQVKVWNIFMEKKFL